VPVSGFNWLTVGRGHRRKTARNADRQNIKNDETILAGGASRRAAAWGGVAWLGAAPLGWPPVNVPTAVLIGGGLERRSRRRHVVNSSTQQ